MRLTDEEWKRIRMIWEKDPRTRLSWLIPELKLSVNIKTIRNRAKKENWTKKEPKNGKRGILDELFRPKTEGVLAIDDTKREESEDFLGLDLSQREKIFVLEYIRDFSALRAATVAGYAAPHKNAYALLKREKISRAVREFISSRALRCGIDGESLIKLWMGILAFDANEFTSYVRYCCPYCYSSNGLPQKTLAEINAARELWEAMELAKAQKIETYFPRPFEEKYELWDISKPPVETCKNCGGIGEGRLIVKDTTKLSPIGLMMYGGVKSGKDGIEIVTLAKNEAMQSLAKALGLFREREAVTEINIVSDVELSKRYEETLEKARERQKKVELERKNIIEGEIAE